jgi:hypothetical protein
VIPDLAARQLFKDYPTEFLLLLCAGTMTPYYSSCGALCIEPKVAEMLHKCPAAGDQPFGNKVQRGRGWR